MNTVQKKLESKLVSVLVSELKKRGIRSCTDLSLSRYSTFAIGGLCALAVFPENTDELMFATSLVAEKRITFEVIGKASNVLFSDEEYNGVLIFTSQMRRIERIGNDRVFAEAGANLTAVSVKAASWGLSGLEFACGIPGSCAGAVYMNAGAYGGEISDVLECSEYYDVKKKISIVMPKQDHSFSYRYSIYQEKNNAIITGVCFKLTPMPIDGIKAAMDEYTQKRRASQPHEYPNAGSIFKRPEGGFAAKMIDECGLKGLCVGGAQVSEKHAGFIVNRGNATASDVLSLIEIIKKRVYESFGVELECEIRIIKQ